MMSLAVAFVAQAALAGNLDLQIVGDVQLRGGYTHTPYITGPDAVPLLNAPTSAAGQYTLDFIVTPGLTLLGKYQDLQFTLAYQPRAFFDLINVDTAPVIFHRLSADIILGRKESWLVTAGSAISVGGIDYGQAGQVVSEFSGSLRPGTSSNTLDFFNLSAYAKLERPIDAFWKFSTRATVSKIDTPPPTANQYLGSNPASDDGTSLGGQATTPTLQSMQRADSKTQLDYQINSQNTIDVALLLQIVTFPGTATYSGITPSVGWSAQLSSLTKVTANLGVMKYWTNPFPGIFLVPRYLVVGDISLDHRFADFGVPRLTGAVSLGEAPYFDIFYGVLEPRGTFTVQAAYEFTPHLQGSVQLRDYTTEYPGYPVAPGRDKNVTVVSAQVKYQDTTWLSYTAGLYGLNELLQASGTAQYTSLQDAYLFVGVTGTFDVK